MKRVFYMYVFLYFIVLGLITYITNKSNDVDSSDEFLQWNKQDLLIIGGSFLASVILQIIDSVISLPILVLPIYTLVLIISIFYVNKNREQHIQSYKKQIEQIFEACSNLITTKEIDYNELPFKIVKDEKVDNQISEIHITIQNPNKFNDANCTQVTFTLNRYFPYYQWKYKNDFPNQVSKFIGEPIPPMVAKWPGSDFRPPEYIPLGLGGAGEVGLDLGAKDFGESSYVDEDGNTPGRVDIPKSPQYIVVGSPLSLNTTIPTTKGYKKLEEIEYGDVVFDIANKPSEVVGISETFMSEMMYRVEFECDGETNYVDSDGKHKFPIFGDGIVKLVECKDLSIGDSVAGNNKSRWKITDKTIIKNEFVRCIKIDSDKHLFLFDNELDEEWFGGGFYPKNAPSTSNTGGGKAVWVDQEIW